MSDIAAASSASFELASWPFLAIAVGFVVVLRVILHGLPRQLALLGLNGAFLGLVVVDTNAWFVLLGVIAGTYALARLKATAWGDNLPGGIWAAVIVALWVFLFFIKQPNLLPAINPFQRFPIAVVGISFIVFRSIAYVLETMPGDRPSVLSLAGYLTFFPTLLSGPIETYERFREFEQGHDLALDESPLPSLHRIANGFLKKYLFAEFLGAFSLNHEASLVAWGQPALLLGLLVLPLVLYCDFSGYCDIVIGVVRLAGFRLAENFDRPWLAANIQDFWQRWHITLSEFIRNYTFNPLWRPLVAHLPPAWHLTAANTLLFLTMVLMGLWHAPTIGFVAFGVLHGLALVATVLWNRWVNQSWPKARRERWRVSYLARGLGFAVTYLVVAVSILFWTQGLGHTWELLVAICGVTHV